MPIEIGNLKITNTKIISNLYTWNRVKGFKNIISTLNYKEILIPLEEPGTSNLLEINKNRISSTNINENVEIKVTLQRNDIQYNLFKNPTVYIEFPSFVEGLSVKDLNLIYADGLEIDMQNAKVSKNDMGNVMVIVPIKGNQTQYIASNLVGTQVILNTDIIVKELTPTVEAEVKAYVHNEKATEYKAVDENTTTINGLEVGCASQTLNFIAPTGILTKGKLSGFNNKNETVSTSELTKRDVSGRLDRNSQEKTVKMELSVINNYKKDCENVRILGRIPAKGSEAPISKKELKTTFNTELKSQIIVGTNFISSEAENIKVYYSENVNATDDLNNPGNGWTDVATNISKSYLIVLENHMLKQGEGLTFSYDFEIPANLGFEEEAFGVYAVLFNKDEYEEAPLLGASTGAGPDLEINITSTAGDAVIHEKEIIRYTVEVTNNGTSSNTDVEIKGIIPEGLTYVIYELNEEEYWEYVKYPESREILVAIPELKPEEKKILEYEVIVDNLGSGVSEENIESYAIVTADNFEGELKSNSITNTVKKADLIVGIGNGIYSRGYTMPEGTETTYVISIQSISENVINNILVSDKLDGFEYVDAYIEDFDYDLLESIKIRDNISYDNATNTIKYNISSLDSKAIKVLTVIVKAKELDVAETKIKAENIVNVAAQGQDLYRGLYTNYIETAKMDFSIEADILDEIIKEGTVIEYIIKVTNNTSLNAYFVKTFVNFPEGTTFISAEPAGTNTVDKIEWSQTTLKSGETLEYKFKLKIEQLPKGEDQKYIEVFANLSTETMAEKASNILTYIVEKEETDDEEIIPDTYTVSGVAWLDENRNGIKESTEKLLPNIDVLLINADTEEKTAETTTNSSGLYVFKDVPDGEYFVVFMYDTDKYDITTYRKSEAAEDVISTAVDGILNISGVNRKVAITDKITINDSNIYYINIGLLEKLIFDLSIDKTVTSITVKNGKEEATKQYDNSKLAKFDINQNYVVGAVVTIEYAIQVKNEGAVPGYAKKVVDYIPKDVIFNKDLNPGWGVSVDGSVYNLSLAETEIIPGETREIKMVITKVMTRDNTGLVTNTAEIAEYYNDQALKDENNKNNTSYAEGLITIALGRIIVYISIILVAGLVLGAGIFIINKRALRLGNLWGRG